MKLGTKGKLRNAAQDKDKKKIKPFDCVTVIFSLSVIARHGAGSVRVRIHVHIEE